MSSFGFNLQNHGLERETLRNPPLDLYSNPPVPLPPFAPSSSAPWLIPAMASTEVQHSDISSNLFTIPADMLGTYHDLQSNPFMITGTSANALETYSDPQSNPFTIRDISVDALGMLPDVPPLNAETRAAGSPGSVPRPSRLQASDKENRPPRPRLTKEARKIAGVRQREASAAYSKDLDGAWEKIDEAVGQIARTHHKSVRRVQTALHMGRTDLTSKHRKPSAWQAFLRKVSQESDSSGRDTLINNTKKCVEAYRNLSQIERNELEQQAKGLLAEKATKAIARQPSNRSKLNDISFTIQKLENELNNLRSRTGCESLLFAVRGTTDMSLRGISFATQGVENFLPGTMMIDPQHFMSKLEGHAIQGLKGSGKNHAQRVRDVRSQLRQIIDGKLVEAVGDTNTAMKWKFYWRDIVVKHRVKVEGWPESVPFKNLSDSTGTLHVLESLLAKWESGEIYWRRLTDAEFKDLEKEHEEAITDGRELEPGPRKQRADKGKKRAAPGAQSAGHQSKRARQTLQNALNGGDNAGTNVVCETVVAEQAPEPSFIHTSESAIVDLSPGTSLLGPNEQFNPINPGLAEFREDMGFGEDFNCEFFDSVLELIRQENSCPGGLDFQEGSSTGRMAS